MGRPAEHGPVVAVDIDGAVLLWCQGEITGPRGLRAEAVAAGLTGRMMRLGVHGPAVTAALQPDLALGGEALVPVAATLLAASPGRARLIEAPEAVWAALDGDPGMPPDATPLDGFPVPEVV